LKKYFDKSDNFLIFADLQNLMFKHDIKLINKNIIELFKILKRLKKNLILPTFNLEFPKTKKTNFDIKNIKTGYLNKFLCKKFNFKRTSKPMYNYALYGPKTKKILNLNQSTAWGNDSVIGYLVKNNSYGLGINIDPKIFNWLVIHYCEEDARVPYRFYKKFYGYNTSTKKKVIEKMYVRNLKKNKIEDGSKINKILIKKRIIKSFKFGIFDIFLLPLGKYYDIASKNLKKNKYFLVKNVK